MPDPEPDADPTVPADDAPDAPFRKRTVSFVRRSGRMTEAQERAWSDLAPFYALPLERDGATTSVRAGSEIDPASVFGRAAPLVVEIGSGQGHAIVHAAAARPDGDFIAVEVFKAGLARTMLDAERAGVRNLRVVEANAPEVLEHLLPEASVDELWVFFPDPWHKHKHTKRRLIAPPFPALAARVLRDGGVLRLATDWEDYALQMRDVMADAADFEPAFDGDWAPRYPGRVVTAFERKGAAKGRAIRDLSYRRKARS
ncbi:tRNA (guanosine(46)-N7)-methyltransferase TrmB [Microbacterium sp. zg.Y1090]|uniref:tRNA (guanosine(46)-N7)-methyltransferase TrmB n=1 Tax=Microbacterium wangruii TaxID=3049073 RepID=UPI00214C8C38|nr:MULTISPECIES: tRNA (guanosine(46)-N7)-methyltransferase TrmB [unclassified Microbacterium]MCR2818157.1 tRNA (guanosine(46)-N7)-methyltransferase TrmB [Microbacterium sp. zg.Y1090]MDL5486679.1 tRNA (guanosine(46)-N7)-methyltransferase TrmB [Microbacterium sp. zg-Y1211]WIM27690.1 tRNA (guanosine(46)-N7)-methyltransferase TrmB [Microbacterium sp. zg-Y1090]